MNASSFFEKLKKAIELDDKNHLAYYALSISYFKTEKEDEAAKMLEKYQGTDAEEIIGDKIFDTCHFEEQKEYVNNIILNESDKRLDTDFKYTYIKDLSEDWTGYEAQRVLLSKCAPSETSIKLSINGIMKSDIVSTDLKMLKMRQKILQSALDINMMAPNTVNPDEYSTVESDKIFN